MYKYLDKLINVQVFGFLFPIITEKIDGGVEAKLVVQALRINTISKLTFSDSIRYSWSSMIIIIKTVILRRLLMK